MQPLVREILEIARSKDEIVREKGLFLIDDILDLQHACESYDYRLKHYGHIPERYLAIYLFEDEWGQIGNFLSRLFIDDYSEVTEKVINSLFHLEDAEGFEPLLDIMIEIPDKLDQGSISDQFMFTFQKLIDICHKKSKRKLKKLLKTKSPIPFFKKWAASEDPETSEAGISWLKTLKEDYGIE